MGESSHYLSTVPEGCLCYYTTQRIPGEPQMPSYLDAEPNFECPVHFPASSDVEAQRALDEWGSEVER